MRINCNNELNKGGDWVMPTEQYHHQKWPTIYDWFPRFFTMPLVWLAPQTLAIDWTQKSILFRHKGHRFIVPIDQSARRSLDDKIHREAAEHSFPSDLSDDRTYIIQTAKSNAVTAMKMCCKIEWNISSFTLRLRLNSHRNLLTYHLRLV